MDLPKQVIEKIKNADTGKLGSSLFQKAKVFAWETGLGTVINALPAAFGEQSVLYFPGRSGKFAFPCCERDSKVLLALNDEDLEKISSNLLQSPGVEIWMKSGWYAGTARLLSDEEKAALTESVTDQQFFGSTKELLGKPSLQEHHLLEVTRTAPCTGRDGPGSKSWIWPAAAFLLLFSGKKK